MFARERMTAQIMVWVRREDLPADYDQVTKEDLAQLGYIKPTIKAVDGLKLLPGMYKIEAISSEDNHPAHKVGDIFTVGSDYANSEYRLDPAYGGYWVVTQQATIQQRIGTYVSEVSPVA